MLSAFLCASITLSTQAPEHMVTGFTYSFSSQIERYKASILRTGVATFDGMRYPKRPGEYTARYTKDNFWKLDMALEKIGFWALPDEKPWGSGHAGMISITITSDRGTKSILINVANERSEHWTVRTLLKSMIDQLEGYRKIR